MGATASGTDYNAGSVTVPNGGDVTCTITNDDIAPQLTLVKDPTNDDGGNAAPDDFLLTIGGEAATSGTAYTLDANTPYAIDETQLDGYTFVSITGDSKCPAALAGTITLDEGDDITCTITNDDIAPQLTLVKDPTNDDGGNAAPDDFLLTIGGEAATSGTAYTLDANTPYAIDETQLDGYTFVSITGDPKCPAALAGTITLDEGDDITCTITNDDIAPQLTLVKDPTNDDGGNAAPDDFLLTIGGEAATSGTAYTLDANTPYAIDETQLDGYTFVSITGDPKCPADLAGTITLDEGDDITCTITNDDDQGSLTLVKRVVNDNGGSATVADFELSTSAGDLTWNDVVTVEDTTTYTSNTLAVDAGPYTFSETNFAGYSEGSWSCVGAVATSTVYYNGSVTVPNGGDVTCTITNDDIAPQLTLVKDPTNDDGGNAAPDDFLLTIGGEAATSSTAYTLDANTPYAIDETQLDGYTFVSITGDSKCPAALAGTITLDEGDDITCTITNDDIAPQLTLVKELTNDNGGNAAPDDFLLTIGGEAATSSTAYTLDANTPYAIDETQLDGYTFVSITGDSKCPAALAGTITLDEGDDITCTITNDDIAPQLTLVKDPTNDDGGNAAPDDFLLTIGGEAATSGTAYTLDANTPYAIDEIQLDGYTFVSITGDPKCPAALAGTITLDEGDDITCTITNDDIAPQLTLVKEVIKNNGGNAAPDDFLLTIGGEAATSGTAYTLDANTPYAIDETQLDGYTFVSITGDSKCPAALAGTITLDEGDDITCTITNDDIAPQLTLVKDPTNDDGGNAAPDDFLLTIGGEAATSGTAYTLDANTPYAIDETQLDGYTFVSITGDPKCPAALAGTITLDEGDDITCTITNDDIAPQLTLVKDPTNDDGGNAAPDDFLLTIGGEAATSGTAYTLDANTPYAIDETQLDGYTFVSITGDSKCPAALAGTITLDEGDDITCTIINDDIAPQLTLVKDPTNDDGGNAAPDDFLLTIGGEAATSGTAYTLDANTPYAIDETQLDGYTFVSITGDSKCPAALAGTITLDEGDDITCTITNDDIAPQLTLVKEVIKNNGGNAAPDDFLLTIGGEAATSGTAYTLDANTPYAIDETQLDGYTFVSITGDSKCPAALAGTITLDEGDDITCTITNDDIAPQLTLVKDPTNDDGGNAAPDDFLLTIGGEAATSGTAYTLDANTPYAIDETQLDGYTFVSITGDPKCPAALAGTITLDEGDDITCTITNDDIAPQLTLVKDPTNDDGGNAAPDDFLLTIGGEAATSGTAYTLDANTPYAIDETQLDGYTFVSITGDSKCPAALAGTITLDEGDDITCTIINDDIAPQLTLVKDPTNDDGGNAAPDDFLLTIGGEAATSGTAYTLDANTPYAIDETQLDGYTFVSITGDSKCPAALAGTITLDEGDDITCTIINDDIAPQLTLVKDPTNDDGGNAAPDDFLLTIGGEAATSGTAYTLDANTPYAIDETQLDGYTFVSITGDSKCPAALAGTITLDEGDDITCTIINDDIAPQLTLVKDPTNDDGGNAAPDDFLLTIGGEAATSGTAYTLDANTPYAIDETQLDGYTFVSITGDSKCPAALAGTITLNEGDDITCTIINDDIAPQLTLVKDPTNDDGGNAAPDDFLLTIGGEAATSSTAYTLDANTPYAIDETQLDGYTFVSITGDSKCPAALAGTITLDEGDDITCTITNDDIAPQLTLVKEVIKNNGGNAAPDDFLLTIGGEAATSGTAYTLDANTPYAIDEIQLDGYTFVSITGDPKCPAALAGTITLDEGDDITCTITNDDIAPQLTLVKEVIKNNGGTAVAGDWTLTATGYNPNQPLVGTYSLSESGGPAGYTLTSLTCNDSSGTSLDSRTVTLGLGEDVICTFVNDDDAPSLTLVKEVNNDNGGTLEATEWTLTATGPTDISGFGGASSGASFDAGTYTLSETDVDGYSVQTDWACTGDATNTGDSITLGLGDSAECTIVNTDDPPSLTLFKSVINDNGGQAVAGDWTLTADGYTPLDPQTGTYDLSESGPDGYTQTSLTCDNADGQVTSVTLGLGEDVTCTFVNDDIAPQLNVIKLVEGDASSSAFTMEVEGTNVSTSSFPGSVDGTTVTLNAGSYTVRETTDLTHYAAAFSDDCSGTIALGETKTCIVTNSLASIKITKSVSTTDTGPWVDSLSYGQDDKIYWQIIVENDGYVKLDPITYQDLFDGEDFPDFNTKCVLSTSLEPGDPQPASSARKIPFRQAPTTRMSWMCKVAMNQNQNLV